MSAIAPTPANTLNEQWQLHEPMLVPREASELQRKATRRAFYAGAASLSLLINTMREQNPQTAVAVAMVEGWESEITVFADQVLRGVA